MSGELKKRVSVRYELETLRQAVDGARMITDVVRHDQTLTEADEKLGPEAVAGILTLVGERIRLVETILAGGADPGLMAAPHNTVVSEAETGDLYIPRYDKPPST